MWIVPAIAGAQAAPAASGGLFGQSSSPFGASSSGGLFGGANTGGTAGLGRSKSFEVSSVGFTVGTEATR